MFERSFTGDRPLAWRWRLVFGAWPFQCGGIVGSNRASHRWFVGVDYATCRFSSTPSGSFVMGVVIRWRRPPPADLPPATVWQAFSLLWGCRDAGLVGVQPSDDPANWPRSAFRQAFSLHTHCTVGSAERFHGRVTLRNWWLAGADLMELSFQPLAWHSRLVRTIGLRTARTNARLDGAYHVGRCHEVREGILAPA